MLHPQQPPVVTALYNNYILPHWDQAVKVPGNKHLKYKIINKIPAQYITSSIWQGNDRIWTMKNRKVENDRK